MEVDKRKHGENFVSNDVRGKNYYVSPRKKFKNNNHRFQRNNYNNNEEHTESQNTNEHAQSFGNNHRISKKPIVISEECDSYFKNALNTLKQGIDDDQKETFIKNVLEQTIGQELQLSSESISSRCIDLLLETADDLPTVIRFMKAFAANKEDACWNPFASHITENLIYLGLKHIQNWTVDIEPDPECEESCQRAADVITVLTWIHDLGEFCLGSLTKCLEDEQAAPVLRTVVQALGGFYVSQAINQSKRSKEHKRFFEKEYLGSNHVAKPKESISLEEVPKYFVDVLKRLAKDFLKLEKIIAYAIDAKTSGVLQSFLFVLKRRLPKRSKKFVRAIMDVLFERKSREGVSMALINKNTSFVVEKVFEAALENVQVELWNNLVSGHLELLVSHPVSNHVIQRFFDVVENKELFETMTQSITAVFPAALSARNYGVFLSVASACTRLKSQESQFIQGMMQCLHCCDPEDRQLQLVPLVLGFRQYKDSDDKTNADNCLPIVLQGSLLVQSMLKFHKPIKIVRSILALKPDEIKYIACHIQGCHVLTSFLNSPNIGEKNKDKFLQLLKSVLSPLGNDRNGSLTLSRMWVLLSLKQKAVIAQEISNNEKDLKDSQSGSLLLKKFGIFHFKNRHDQWKEFQQKLTKKRQHED